VSSGNYYHHLAILPLPKDDDIYGMKIPTSTPVVRQLQAIFIIVCQGTKSLFDGLGMKFQPLLMLCSILPSRSDTKEIFISFFLKC